VCEPSLDCYFSVCSAVTILAVFVRDDVCNHIKQLVKWFKLCCFGLWVVCGEFVMDRVPLERGLLQGLWFQPMLFHGA
jgi:hypothetical protein